MAITARNDFDRLSNGLATGNVVSGVGTLSGNLGKDTPGLAPNRVTQINFDGSGASVGPAGASMNGDFGTLHMNPDGSYTYTRTAAITAVPAGAMEVFTYYYADKSNMPVTAELTILVLSETAALADKNGVHKGTGYDDFIDTALYQAKTADGLVTVDGGDGQDKIDATNGTGAHLLGGAGNDWLIGGAGNAILEGGAGADRIDGAGDNDVASYASAKAGVTASLFSNSGNTGGDAAGDILLNVEHLAGSDFNDSLTGDGAGNILDGGKGNDTLNGLSGGDTLIGGAGADTMNGGNDFDYASYASASAGVVINLANSALSSGDAKGDSYTSIEGLKGSAFNDKLFGDTQNNRLEGLAGDDLLDGGDGHDVLVDTAGNNQLFGGAGKDQLFGGIDVDVLDGGVEADVLKGNAGNDVLIGGAGADHLEGQDGIDRASYANLLAGLLIDLEDSNNSTGDATGDTYWQTEILEGTQGDDTILSYYASPHLQAIWGGKGNDTLLGDVGYDDFDGGDGNDTLHGGDGYDTLTGGAGDDTISTGGEGGVILADAGKDSLIGTFALLDAVSFANSKAGVTLDLTNTQLSTGDAKGDTYLLIDEYFGSKVGDKFYGSIAADAFHGGLGADKLDGRDGGDTLHGDGGNDTLIGGAGLDKLHGGDNNDTLNGGLEDDDLFGDAGNDKLFGNDGDDDLRGGDNNDALDGGADDDELFGDAGNDVLTGGIGDDELEGAVGSDKLDGGDGSDTLVGGDGIDTLIGGKNGDILLGGANNDVVNGGTGIDFIDGGTGADKLTGGADGDFFMFKVAELDAKDTITDFKFGEDKLHFLDVVDGAGSDLQDLLDAGVNASSSGTTLSIFMGDQVAVTISGWSGPQITSMQDLSVALDSNLTIGHI